MKQILISVPTMFDGRVVLKGITEPETSVERRISIISYKSAGDLNEHWTKYCMLGGSKIHLEEMRTSLGETICHCIVLANKFGWGVPELVDLGWEKIGHRFVDFEKSGKWIDKEQHPE